MFIEVVGSGGKREPERRLWYGMVSPIYVYTRTTGPDARRNCEMQAKERERERVENAKRESETREKLKSGVCQSQLDQQTDWSSLFFGGGSLYTKHELNQYNIIRPPTLRGAHPFSHPF